MAKKETSGSNYYYLYNAHGDVVQIVDTSGNVVNNYSYDEWGNTLTKNESIANPFKYSGEIMDEETGLYYLRSRYYDPTIGRFINKDTYEGDISDPLSLNLYTYVNNNPLLYVDPSGHMGLSQIKQLVKGMIASIGDTIKDLLKSPLAMLSLGKAIIGGSLNIIDVGKSIGASVADPILYLARNTKHVIGGDPTNAEVYEYGKQLGNVLQMALGSGAALKIIAKAAPKFGKFLSKIEGCNCFTAGTKVLTDEGEKNIEDIKVGDMVLAKSEFDSNGELAYKEVTALYTNYRNDIIKLYIGDLLIETTDNHPFWVEGRGWVYADELKAGDKLQKADGSNLTIDEVEFVLLDEPVMVYNFTVEDYHTYYVTDIGIWVHNTYCPLSNNMQTKVSNDSVIPPGKRGNAPISNQDGKPIEIHHEGQNPNGPFHEMSRIDHRGGDNYKKNHPNSNQPSQIDRNLFNQQRTEYWNNEWDNGRWN